MLSRKGKRAGNHLQDIANTNTTTITAERVNCRQTRSRTKQIDMGEEQLKATKDQDDASVEVPAKRAKMNEAVEDGGKEVTATEKENKEVAKSEEPTESTHSLSHQLKSVISNLYLNVTERLQLECVPRCVEDLENCFKYHYRAPEPEAPNHTQRENLRAALQNERYMSFVNAVVDMAHRREFPGDGIFTKLLELVLSINPKKANNEGMQQLCTQCIELFSFIVSSFPPCWLSIRHYYVSFFQRGLNVDKLKKKDRNQTQKSTKVFEIVLDLLDSTLTQCSADELSKVCHVGRNERSSADSPQSSIDHSMCSEFNNPWEWEERERSYQTFEALEPGERLDRLFVALRLLLQILESDLVMWILHHHKKTKDWIFCRENRPLAVLVFDLAMHLRLSPTVKRFFAFFALAVQKNLHHTRLQVLERYIVLLMIASNTADMENKSSGVKYPYLGTETKNLIHEFFKIFKAQNQSTISAYLKAIELLRIPFVRYEFIDHFLNFTSTDDMWPKKVAYNIKKMHWLKYKPRTEIEANAEEELSREQYLDLLLIALKAYCEWHGLHKLFQLWVNKTAIAPFRTTTDSVHRWPVQGNGVLMLQKMAKDIHTLEQQLRFTVRMSKPQVDLPQADICIDDDIKIKYRNDLKHIVLLHDMLAKITAEQQVNVDFGAWQAFLAQFSPRPS